MKKTRVFILSVTILILTSCQKDELQIPVDEPAQEIKKERVQPSIKKEEPIKPELSFSVNGEQFIYGTKPIVNEMQTIVPLRETAERLGWKVTWKSNSFVLIENKESTLRFKVGEDYYIKNDEKHYVKETFKLVEDNVLIPLRPIVDAMGGELVFNKENNTIDIRYRKDSEDAIKKVDIPILVYHGLEPGRFDTLMIDPNRFKEQMIVLKENGYTTITEHDLLTYMKEEKNLPDKPILIHFDDGYESVYTYAYPILKELNMQATSYIVGTTVKEKTGDSEPYSNSHLSWEQIKEMYHSGLIEFQSHTYNTHGAKGVFERPSGESDEKYKERLVNDFNKSKTLIEGRLKNHVISLAYPIGNYNDMAIESAKKAGYEMAMSMNGGKVQLGDSLYTLDRVYISGSDQGQSLLNKIQNLW